jgi:hypothetical protein
MFMKKWWLEFSMPDGRRWSGWINTMSSTKEGFPAKLDGTFWTERNESGAHGKFELGDGDYGENYVFGSMKPAKYEPKFQSYEECSRMMESDRPLDAWERVERRISECLCLGSTYVVEC